MTTPVRLSYSLRDAQGVEGSECFYGNADDATLVTDAADEWTTFAGLLDAVTGAQITGGSVSILMPATGKGSPAADSRIEEVGIFNFRDAGPFARRNGFDVLAIKDTVLTSGGKSIDLTNTAVAAFFAALTATGGLIRFANQHGQALTALVDALLAFRKRRAQLSRSSFEVAP